MLAVTEIFPGIFIYDQRVQTVILNTMQVHHETCVTTKKQDRLQLQSSFINDVRGSLTQNEIIIE